MRRYLSQKDVCGSVIRTAVSENEIHRESHVKGNRALNLVEILIGECHAQGVDIGFQVFNLSLPDDRENIGRFVEDICERLSRRLARASSVG